MLSCVWRRTAVGTIALLFCASAGVCADSQIKIKEGDHAPDIELPAAQVATALPDQKNAKTLHLKDLEGKKNVVLYFFPKAATRG